MNDANLQNQPDNLSFDDVLSELAAPREALYDLLKYGDVNFPAVKEDPIVHKYSVEELDQLKKFREVLHLPLDTFTDDEIAGARSMLLEDSLDFGDDL